MSAQAHDFYDGKYLPEGTPVWTGSLQMKTPPGFRRTEFFRQLIFRHFYSLLHAPTHNTPGRALAILRTFTRAFFVHNISPFIFLQDLVNFACTGPDYAINNLIYASVYLHLYTFRKVKKMTGKRKKTVLRTIRLAEEVDDLLERDASKQNISTNALVGKIMTRYVEWDRVVEKLDFVAFSNALFLALINEVSDEKIQEMASHEAIRQIKNHAIWDSGKTDFDVLLKTILLIGKYGLMTNVSVESWGDGNYVITLRHRWGHKGVVFFRSFFDSFVRNELGVHPTIDMADDVIAVSFHRPLKRTS